MWCLFTIFLLFLTTTTTATTHRPHRHVRRQHQSLVSAGWYTSWHSSDFPLDQVSWSKYTHMYYAFAVPTPDSSVIDLAPADEELLPQFVAAAHEHDVKASVSIGGWTGSRFFSSSVGSSKNRTKFTKAITQMVEKYDLDGIDFDWEYPGFQQQGGLRCNVVNANDTSNFLTFLKELRSTSTGSDLILSAAVYTKPFVDTTGQPSSNLSEFADVLNHVAIMNYDTKSTPSTGAGPNAPLDDSCAPAGARTGSAMAAVDAWVNSGIPANKLLLGVPAYGYSFVVSPSVAFTSSDNRELLSYPVYDPIKRKGDKWDSEGGLNICGDTEGPGGFYSYWGLIQEGFLNSDGTVPEGLDYRFDNCSCTPLVYNSSTDIYITYDNVESFTIKGNYINVTGLAGFSMWEVAGDYKDVLLDAIIIGTRTSGDPSRFTRPTTNTAPSTSPTSSSPQSSLPPTNLHLQWIIYTTITLSLFSILV